MRPSKTADNGTDRAAPEATDRTWCVESFTDAHVTGDGSPYGGPSNSRGGASVASAYFDHGVDTVVYIHADGAAEQQLREGYGDEKNLVVTSHIASDAVGMNVLIDELAARGVDCTAISGCGLGRP